MKDYNHLEIEKKWQKEWQKKKVFEAKNNSKKKKLYVLDMFPYPSGVGLHVGHPKGYVGSDVYARMKRMQGFNVLHPMGYDAFGLPAEQYALEHHIHPRKAVMENVKTFENQLQKIGLSFDWTRKINTTDPEFYKWTQWIFLKLYNSWYNKNTNKAEPIETLIKKLEKTKPDWKLKTEKERQDILMGYRLAYEGWSEVNWCPILGTVLANDEIVDSAKGPVSERGGFPVVKKEMRQWFLRITAYADRLLSGLDRLDWSDHIKEIQRNWIGKSEGAEIDFDISRNPQKIKIFTTRPDTIFGATYMVLAPEHKIIEELWSQIENKEEIQDYIEKIKNKTEIERTGEDKEKTGVEIKGIKAINPATNEKIPVWIADYVLVDYGTGAIMAVPADDKRDFDFATKFNLPIVKDYKTAGFEDFGKKIIKFKMRDAVFARQRYWGEPIPLKQDKNGIIYPLKDKELPLKLPEVKSYMPTGTGESPLASVSSWVKKGLETNTMPGWAGSSWYFLRYMDPKNKKVFADKKAIKYWKNVDMYVGGAEHATGHLLYSRFWHKFLKDYGLVVTEEPFKTLRNQGVILGPDGRKMSKRWGNTINPDDVIKTYGADTMRVYEMFMGPFEGSLPWSTDNIIGSRRFLEKIWRIQEKVEKKISTNAKFNAVLHRTIKKVGEDIESFSFNTAISAMMILLNEMEKLEKINQKDFEIFLKILSPFAPHITEEIWKNIGYKKLLTLEQWPKGDTKKMLDLEVKIVIQINGKVRAEYLIELGSKEEEVVSKVKNLPDVEKWIMGKNITRVIFVPNKLVNFVLE